MSKATVNSTEEAMSYDQSGRNPQRFSHKILVFVDSERSIFSELYVCLCHLCVPAPTVYSYFTRLKRNEKEALSLPCS